MKTICDNGFVATHALGHMLLRNIYTKKVNKIESRIKNTPDMLSIHHK